MFYQPPSLTLSWNLIKQKKKRKTCLYGNPKWPLLCMHWYLFHLPEAQRAFQVQRLLGASAWPTAKWMTVPQTRMEIQIPAAPVAPESRQPADPSGAALAGMSPSAKTSPPRLLSNERSRFGLQYRTAYVCECSFLSDCLGQKPSLPILQLELTERCAKPHIHTWWDNKRKLVLHGKVPGEGLPSWLWETKYSLHGCRETPQNHC